MRDYELRLNGLRCQVRLGWGEEERKTPQGVLFDLTFRFAELPSACVSDELDETVCYSQVAEKLRGLCASREFRLVERLGFDAFSAVRETLPRGVTLALQVTKERPPVEGLLGGASFRIGDWSAK